MILSTGGHAWEGVCMAGGECEAGALDIRGGGHAWQGVYIGGAWVAGGMGGGGCGWQGVCMAGGACMAAGVYMAGRCIWQGACMAGEMATAAGDTHPTGMHSCCELNYWL